jgi:hypothetical protein
MSVFSDNYEEKIASLFMIKDKISFISSNWIKKNMDDIEKAIGYSLEFIKTSGMQRNEIRELYELSKDMKYLVKNIETKND